MNEHQEVYPVDIIPQKRYKKKLSIDRLLGKYVDLMVVRLVPGNIEDHVLITELGERIIQDSVFENNMANLSMNLAGGLFNTSSDAHLRFLPISDYGTAEWKGGKVKTDNFLSEDSFSFISNCFGLCFQVKLIHKRAFPFHKGFKKQGERDAFAKKVDEVTTVEEKRYDAHIVGKFINKNTPVEVKGRLKVHHSPTNGNYWHITLDTYRPDSMDYVKAIEKQSSTDKHMFKALKQDLVQRCGINVIPNYHISRRIYLKWPYSLIASFVG